jgi:hypothetical protein
MELKNTGKNTNITLITLCMEYESGVSAEEGDRTYKNRKRRIGEEQRV